MQLSIVAALFRSSAMVEEFRRRCLVAAERVTGDFEITLVDGGSADDSLENACTLVAPDPRIRVSRAHCSRISTVLKLVAARTTFGVLNSTLGPLSADVPPSK